MTENTEAKQIHNWHKFDVAFRPDFSSGAVA